MAATFFVMKKKQNGFATLFVRLQVLKQKVDYKGKTPIEVNFTAWNNSLKGPTARDNFRKANPDLWAMMEKIKNALEETESKPVGITLAEFKDIILETYYKEQRAQKAKEAEEEAKAKAEAARITLNRFIDMYIEEVSNGGRQTDKGTNYAPATIKAIKASVTQFKEYQQKKKKYLDFDDIDMQFY